MNDHIHQWDTRVTSQVGNPLDLPLNWNWSLYSEYCASFPPCSISARLRPPALCSPDSRFETKFENFSRGRPRLIQFNHKDTALTISWQHCTPQLYLHDQVRLDILPDYTRSQWRCNSYSVYTDRPADHQPLPASINTNLWLKEWLKTSLASHKTGARHWGGARDSTETSESTLTRALNSSC